ncbi:hypothetical protein PJE062_1169 [Pseudovibrio sp. JE062]|nr:hypothetical protein PJE062_1169 [Pseudovibrio sp. JE062]
MGLKEQAFLTLNDPAETLLTAEVSLKYHLFYTYQKVC